MLGAIDFFKADPDGTEALAYYNGVLRRMDQALSAKEPTFLVPDDDAVGKRQFPNPVKGRVVLLTDYWCNSACLDLMDLFLRLPGTVQAGTETNADTIFMEETNVDLPSGRLSLGCGAHSSTTRYIR